MTDDAVSRETAPPPVPEAARGAVSLETLAALERYVAWLSDAGIVRGLIGPRERGRLWERHILNSLAVADTVGSVRTLADVGSGAGLPGLVVAIARPDLQVTLIEPLLRRTTFLTEVVEDLGLDSVEVIRGRADVLHGERTFDVVTSRAVAALPTLLDWSMPLVAADGRMLALKGSSAAQEVEDAREALARWRCAEPVLSEVGVAEAGTTVVEVAWAGAPVVTSTVPRSRRPVARSGSRRSDRPGTRRAPRQQRSSRD